VKALVLDHLIPVLAFSLEEKLSVRINKQALARKGLRAGRWLSKLRKSIYLAEPDDVVLPVPTADGEGERALTLGELKRDLVTLGPGQKIVYATDFIGSKANMENLAAFAKGATVLFCEAAFLEEDRAHAVMKYHLTAKQCGQVARDAGAAAVVPFHFSPKYKARPESVAKEVMDAFLSPSS
jgi:ribonuclease Z